MVKITNGINVFEVTKGAFDGIYSRQGYSLVGNEKIEAEQNIDNDVDKSEDVDTFCKEIIEKPIAQWSKSEVKKFAELKEIDISGTKSANEAKELIKAFIDSPEQE